MMVSHPSEALVLWFQTQLMTTPELQDLVLRGCSVSTFRQAHEIVFVSPSVHTSPLILSCFGSKITAFNPPTLHDLDDPMRELAVVHAYNMVQMFEDLVDTAIKHHPQHASFFKQHINMVIETAVEVSVLSADRNQLTLLAWYQGERNLIPTTHTYDLHQLVLRERLYEANMEHTSYAGLKASNEFITDAFVNLLKTKRPNRRTLPHVSILAFCARILRNSGPGLKGLLSAVFEDDTLKVMYEAGGTSLHFKLLEELPTNLQGNYEPIIAYQELDCLLEQEGKQDHDLVWHFSRLPTRFNNKPSKRAVAYTREQNSMTFYHPFEKLYLQISVRC